MMKRIGDHPHIVKFLGCVSKVHPICLILEFIPYGDLLSLLRKLRIEKVSTSIIFNFVNTHKLFQLQIMFSFQ